MYRPGVYIEKFTYNRSATDVIGHLSLLCTVYSYCMGLRGIAFLLYPEAQTISRGKAEGNCWCRGGQWKCYFTKYAYNNCFIISTTITSAIFTLPIRDQWDTWRSTCYSIQYRSLDKRKRCVQGLLLYFVRSWFRMTSCFKVIAIGYSKYNPKLGCKIKILGFFLIHDK
jgi:hypothetical protein